MKSQIERRTLVTPTAAVKLRNGQGKGKLLTGYAAKFYDGTPGTEFELRLGVFERIDRHAFDDSLRRPDDVRGLFNHDPSLILARTASGTMRLSVDGIGLRFEIDIPDSPVGWTVAEAVRRGDVSGCSFSFTTRRDDWTDNVRTLLSVSLLDVGPVTYPAYSATSVAVPRTVKQIADDRRIQVPRERSDYDRNVDVRRVLEEAQAQDERDAKSLASRLERERDERLIDSIRERRESERFDALLGR